MAKIKSAMRRLIIGLIRCYQLALSPLLGSNCRFYPTCSAYGIEAVEKHGALKGGYLTIKRILRCNPFCQGGFDPVPPTQAEKNAMASSDTQLDNQADTIIQTRQNKTE